VPLQKLQFRPGVNREGTTLANEGGWFECDKVRFRSGYPEKIGGWSVVDGTYNTFLGVCRSLLNWVTLRNFTLLGVGTSLKFYIAYGGEYFDITPISEINGNTGSAGPPVINASTITLTASGTVLTVSDSVANSLQVGNFVTIAGAGTIGGVDVNGEYQIASVISGTTYTVTLATSASGSNAAATITITYQIATGSDIFTVGTGWGAGPWAPHLVTTLTNPFSTNTGTPTVITVTQANHGLDTGDYVSFVSISDTSVGGIPNNVLQKAFQITKTGTNTYTISTVIGNITYNATSTSASEGGTVVVNYPDASNVASYDRGWGVGFTSNIGIQLRLWSQANFGEILLFSPRGGALYEWDPTSATTPDFATPGQLVSGTDIPAVINEIMVSDASRIVIAFGCSDYGSYPQPQDPMLIRWTAQESYTNWTPSISNQAGSYRLSHGSYIVGSLQSRQEILVWTDAAIYAMQYLGPPFVWGFTLLADNTSIMSPNAMATANGVTYWMGTDKFYMYSGRVETLPCALRQYVFGDINRDQSFQVVSGTNEGYSEVWWFYCSANSTVIDRYVIFNYLDRVWYYGTMGRTAWLDSPLRQYPQAATYDGLLVFHESTVDDGTTNPPSAISSYIQSSDFDIGDGHNYGFVWQLIPDITFDGSVGPAPTDPNNPANFPQVTFTVRPRQNPGSNYGTADTPTVQSTKSYAPVSNYNVQEFTEIVYTRVRGRQMAFKVSSNTLGTQWQLGTPSINVRPDGRR
jgi:hypothetical protein